LEAQYHALIDSFIANKIGIAPSFISEALSTVLQAHLTLLSEPGQLQQAGTGNANVALQNKLFRSDKIYWLDRSHQQPAENDFLDMMDAFVANLNATCYTGITGYEFHFAIYEAGTFYHKHFDQFDNNDSRKYTMIFYLNSNWLPGDGGELCIHHIDSLQLVEPTNGTSVFFQSNIIEHEVLLSHKQRMSITGWLKVN